MCAWRRDRHLDREPAVSVSNDLGARLHHRAACESVRRAMRTDSPMVLVHGAFQSGATWDLVVPRLREARRRVIVATLTGLGPDAGDLSETVSLATHIHDVVALLKRHDLDDVVLVGHSYAGMVITGVAEHAADRV